VGAEVVYANEPAPLVERVHLEQLADGPTGGFQEDDLLSGDRVLDDVSSAACYVPPRRSMPVWG
jgi:hypothetical protein